MTFDSLQHASPQDEVEAVQTEAIGAVTAQSPNNGKDIKTFFKVLRAKIAELTSLQLVFIFILMLFMMVGNALQIIGLNFWLREFPYQGQSASFTILAVSGIVFAVFFIVIFVGFVLVKKPDMSFAKSWRSWVLLTGIGFTDTFNSLMNIYAANACPEVLQALFQALMPLYTCVMTKYILRDPRSYVNRWVLGSFALTIIGIVMAAVPDFISGDDDDESRSAKIGWSFIFFASVPLTALMNVWQTKYMEDYTILKDGEGEDGPLNSSCGELTISTRGEPNAYRNSNAQDSYNGVKTTTPADDGERDVLLPKGVDDQSAQHHHNDRFKSKGSQVRGEDTIVKLMMLFGDTTIQAVLSIALLPSDAIPWWGGADTVSDAAMHLRKNSQSIFTEWQCGVYCIIYSAGFVLTYIGGAYLNQYSPTLCCMIGQLSSPMTALVLILVPAWNLEASGGAWYWSVVAVILLSIGTLLYSAWEEMSSQEEARKEQKKFQEVENHRINNQRGICTQSTSSK